MKKTIISVLVCCLTLSVMAQQDIRFTVSDGIKDTAAKQRMEQSISQLLTEVNAACAQERPLALGTIDMAPGGKKSLGYLWQNLRFFCEDSEISERCLTSAEGYVIRNIFIQVNPMVEDYTDERNRELTIRLTRQGQIASVVIANSDHAYERIVQSGKSVTDFERRQTILAFVENFRSHYDEKDLNALRQVFSEDALIITGTVVMKKDFSGDRPQLRPEMTYKVQSKAEYLRNLDQCFKRNKYIKVTFSDIEVVRHPSNPDFYGVTLHQHWKSSTYEDDGYLVLIWEFREDDDPIIHVRSWQPDHIGNRALTREEIINIMDFEIPQKSSF
ncbi:MAG: nuclear transport factor 2 family protein [Prevotella sp.]|nr:nuclear transport factor 2 family protein [Prevotella sp.]